MWSSISDFSESPGIYIRIRIGTAENIVLQQLERAPKYELYRQYATIADHYAAILKQSVT